MSKQKKFALISVSDKSKIENIANYLVKNNFQIISTGGTYKTLKEYGIKVISISDITNFPEIMDGRVKTLHPNVHAGILARQSDENILNDLNIQRISVLITNFYPFEKIVNKNDVTFNEAIENIDIGGPAMVRAAAKNFENCSVLTDPKDYEIFMDSFDPELQSNQLLNKNMSLKAFETIAKYDICIANYFGKEVGDERFPKYYALTKINDLRYGENPHQKASLYINSVEKKISIVNSKKYQGKELSFNNIVDGEAALSCVLNFERPSCVIVKHANPCGVSSSENIKQAYENSYATDPVSAFGGVIAFNRKMEEELLVKILDNQFVELIIAPSFSEKSIDYAKTKKNIRIIEYPKDCDSIDKNSCQIKTISNGFLIQQEDYSKNDLFEKFKVVSEKIPTDKELEDLYFAWIVAKYVKSNAIIFAKDRKTLGIGAGQMSRIDSTIIASIKSTNQKIDLKDAVMASDAFFPFYDNVEKAAELGISSIIQPGGSQNDNEVIKKANELNLSMVFTGIRHFRH